MLGGHCVGSNIYGCQPYLVIAIYVPKSAHGGLFYTPLYLLTLKQVRMFLHRVFQPNVICLAKLIISQQMSSSAELFFSLLRLSNKVIALSKLHDVIFTKLINCKLFFLLFFLCVCIFCLEPIKIS